MRKHPNAGPAYFLRALVLAALFLAAGYTALFLLSRGPFPGGWIGVAWVAGLIGAIAFLLAAVATFLDGAAGLAPKQMAGLYSIAFAFAMIAWVLGFIFLICLFVAAMVNGGGGSGDGGLPGYEELQPKRREPND